MAVSIHGNNGFITTNGTAAAPSLAAPDNDTGLYFGTNKEETPNGINSHPSFVAVHVRGKFLSAKAIGSFTISKFVDVASTRP